MIVERSMHAEWLTNTYLVAAKEAGQAFLVDAGGPVAPLLETARARELEITHVLLTHHHWDHVAELPQVCDALPGVAVLADARERDALAAAVPDLGARVTGELAAGDELSIGGLEVRALATPGHTAGMLSLLVQDGDVRGVFTGDTLFKGSVGGVHAPGHTTYEDLRRSVLDVLLALPADTAVHPGHADPSTVAQELEHNRFVRVWRGLDGEGDEPCRVGGEPARLVLLGPDYDGGHKAWVRWPDGRDDLVPGSRVETG